MTTEFSPKDYPAFPENFEAIRAERQRELMEQAFREYPLDNEPTMAEASDPAAIWVVPLAQQQAQAS